MAKLVTIEPSGVTKTVPFKPDSDGEPSLVVLQQIVGGSIEGIYVTFRGKRCRAYVNEDGRSLGLKENPFASVMAGQSYTWNGRFPIVGTLAVIVP